MSVELLLMLRGATEVVQLLGAILQQQRQPTPEELVKLNAKVAQLDAVSNMLDATWDSLAPPGGRT